MTTNQPQPKVLWKIDPGCYCGLLIPTEAMRRIMKLQAKYQAAVRDIFNDYASECVAYDWTINEDWKETRQVTVYHTDGSNSVADRIRLFKVMPPKRQEYYEVSREEAKQIASAIAKEVQL